MSGSINKAIIVGNVGKDPKIQEGRSGKKLASFSVATSERWKDKDSGERKERTHWHNVVVFKEDLAVFAENNIRKGAKVYVEGSMQTRKWDDNGVDRYMTEVVVNGFGCQLMLAEGGGHAGRDRPGPDEGDYGTTRDRAASESQEHKPRHDMDDDIPF